MRALAARACRSEQRHSRCRIHREPHRQAQRQQPLSHPQGAPQAGSAPHPLSQQPVSQQLDLLPNSLASNPPLPKQLPPQPESQQRMQHIHCRSTQQAAPQAGSAAPQPLSQHAAGAPQAGPAPHPLLQQPAGARKRAQRHNSRDPQLHKLARHPSAVAAAGRVSEQPCEQSTATQSNFHRNPSRSSWMLAHINHHSTQLVHHKRDRQHNRYHSTQRELHKRGQPHNIRPQVRHMLVRRNLNHNNYCCYNR